MDLNIDHNDKTLYAVWLYGEYNALTNVLMGIVTFKNHNNAYLPSSILLRKGNRLDFGLGEDIPTNYADWPLLDAIYLSLYKPIPYVPSKREPTIFKSKRNPVQDITRKFFKFRANLDALETSEEAIDG